MKFNDIRALRHPDCPVCVDGFVCEQHPERPWPHGDCAGPGMPCTAPGCAAHALSAAPFDLSQFVAQADPMDLEAIGDVDLGRGLQPLSGTLSGTWNTNGGVRLPCVVCGLEFTLSGMVTTVTLDGQPIGVACDACALERFISESEA